MAKKTKKNRAGQTAPQTMRWLFLFNKKDGTNYYTYEERPYKKSIDANRKAAPVGYRWSQYAVEKGYAKSNTTKPSAAEIEMYAGKKKNGKLLIYRETRSNKSDAAPKKKI
jgi:hypothetical protein